MDFDDTVPISEAFDQTHTRPTTSKQTRVDRWSHTDLLLHIRVLEDPAIDFSVDLLAVETSTRVGVTVQSQQRLRASCSSIHIKPRWFFFRDR
jgi:hypothetical protein